MEYKKIPSKYKLGGMAMEVRMVERCNDDHAGECFLCSGYMEIAEKFNRDDHQSESCKVNTFYHELVHSILGTMGEYELNENEKFVNCFAGFLADAMDNAYFKEEE